ncbi:MAG: hypothetical protein ABW168_03505 [Sedimenticola sp.]
MTTPVITMATICQCPHGGPVTLATSTSKVLIDNTAPLAMGDKGTVAGCAFTIPSGKPQPCVTALLTRASAKVFTDNKPLLLMNPGDICQSAEQLPQGTVVWSNIQSKVVAD